MTVVQGFEQRLSHIIYASSATPGLSAHDLSHLLLGSRMKNAASGVTGMLLYASGSFFQVLEGEDATIRPLFASIAADTRHRDVTCIIDEPIAHRAFAQWSMGYCEADADELVALGEAEAAPTDRESLSAMPPGRARRLLAAFAEGRWRARVQS